MPWSDRDACNPASGAETQRCSWPAHAEQRLIDDGRDEFCIRPAGALPENRQITGHRVQARQRIDLDQAGSARNVQTQVDASNISTTDGAVRGQRTALD